MVLCLQLTILDVYVVFSISTPESLIRTAVRHCRVDPTACSRTGKQLQQSVSAPTVWYRGSPHTAPVDPLSRGFTLPLEQPFINSSLGGSAWLQSGLSPLDPVPNPLRRALPSVYCERLPVSPDLRYLLWYLIGQRSRAVNGAQLINRMSLQQNGTPPAGPGDQSSAGFAVAEPSRRWRRT